MVDTELLEAIAQSGQAPIEKRAITNLRCLNEAYAYAKPSSFSRGMRIDLNGVAILLISGTASIDESGRSIHIGDFRAQCRRTFWNITQLLESEGATWHDIVRTSCYLRDIERDYEAFNEERTAFYQKEARSRPCIHRHSGDSLPSGTVGRNRSHRDVQDRAPRRAVIGYQPTRAASSAESMSWILANSSSQNDCDFMLSRYARE